MLDTLNQWVANHQALVVAVGVPVLTAIAAGVVSLITTRMNMAAQRRDRDLQLRFRQYESAKERLTALRKLFVEFEFLTFSARLEFGEQTRTGDLKISKERASEHLRSTIRVLAALNLQAPVSDPETKILNEVAKKEMRFITSPEEREEIDPNDRFAQVSSRILNRMEEDLNSILLPPTTDAKGFWQRFKGFS